MQAAGWAHIKQGACSRQRCSHSCERQRSCEAHSRCRAAAARRLRIRNIFHSVGSSAESHSQHNMCAHEALLDAYGRLPKQARCCSWYTVSPVGWSLLAACSSSTTVVWLTPCVYMFLHVYIYNICMVNMLCITAVRLYLKSLICSSYTLTSVQWCSPGTGCSHHPGGCRAGLPRSQIRLRSPLPGWSHSISTEGTGAGGGSKNIMQYVGQAVQEELDAHAAQPVLAVAQLEESKARQQGASCLCITQTLQ